MLLYFSEIIVTHSFMQWAYSAPSDRWMIRGKILYIPNPLNPAQLLFRFDLLPGKAAGLPGELEDLLTFATGLRGIRVFSLLLFVLLGVCLPTIIILRLHGYALIALILAIYLSILAMLILLYRKREALQISRKDWWGFALEALACPPFAINLARKLSLRYTVSYPLLAFASQNFQPKIYEDLTQTIKIKLSEALEVEDKDSARHTALTAYKDALEKSA